MLSKLVTLLFWGLAIIHMMPAISALFPTKLAHLYGVNIDDKTLITLLQHRAILFGLLALACIYAAYTPLIQKPVLIGAVLSMGSFVGLAMFREQLSTALAKIVYVDLIGLAIALILIILLSRT